MEYNRGMAKRRKKTKTTPYVLVAIGLVMVGLWGVHQFFYNRSLSLSDALLAAYRPNTDQVAFPTHITVGNTIGLQVVEGGKMNGVWTVSRTAANHVITSARPGEEGNVIIYGHNLNTVFGYLVDARVGDPVSIRTSDGKLYRYKITKTQIVPPSQTELLSPTNIEVVTLYTCTGLLDSLRFVTRAVPVTP